MATVEQLLPARPEDVFEVLVTPETYPFWLVGCQQIRAVDDGWPAVDTAFHHRVGLAGPITVADSTKVLDIEDGRRLVLEVRARPFGRGRVSFTLTPEGADRTRIRFEEVPIGTLEPAQPLIDPVTVRRNRRSMERLGDLLRVSRILGAGEAPTRGV